MTFRTKVSIPSKMQSFIRSMVREELMDLLSDPDVGREVRVSLVRRLQKSVRSREAGRVSSLGTVARRLGVHV